MGSRTLLCVLAVLFVASRDNPHPLDQKKWCRTADLACEHRTGRLVDILPLACRLQLSRSCLVARQIALALYALFWKTLQLAKVAFPPEMRFLGQLGLGVGGRCVGYHVDPSCIGSGIVQRPHHLTNISPSWPRGRSLRCGVLGHRGGCLGYDPSSQHD